METIDLKFDPNELTLGDLEDFEEFVGKSIEDSIKPVPVLDDEGNRVFDAKGYPEMTTKIPTKAIIGLVWVTKRKETPGFTIADARQIRVSSLVIAETPDQGND